MVHNLELQHILELREAELLAALNHPNDRTHSRGSKTLRRSLALVIELVEGEDLATRVARGPIPNDETLPIARQVADAIEGVTARLELQQFASRRRPSSPAEADTTTPSIS